MKGKFKFLEHMSDAFIEAYGQTLEEAFENAAHAMFEVMVDTSAVKPVDKLDIEVEGEDEYALLYSWLERLLIEFEVSNRVFSKFKVHKIERRGDTLRLRAEIWGEKFDSKSHSPKVAIKAVTYHQMSIEKKDESVTLRVLLDL